jgi:hypothetical protein
MAMARDIDDLAGVGIALAAHVVDLDIAVAEAEAQEEEEARPAARAVWVRPWIMRRGEFGWYEKLMAELEAEDQQAFTGMTRMDPAMFHEIVERLTPRIEKPDTNCRRALVPGLKVAITLYFLATGAPYRTLMHGFRVAHNTIHSVVKEVCLAIFEEYGDLIKCPTTQEEWLEKSQEFADRWNWFHCLGALDGKHIAIKKPPNSGSLYYNYKGFYSVILMALVDAKYRFLWVEMGANGAASDAQIYNASHLKEMLDDGTLGVPPATPLPLDDDGRDIDWFITGDEAFGIAMNMVKPYSRRGMTAEERIFNYRCSRARRVSENAFGILANRFQCLIKVLNHKPETVKTITLACLSLHNLMRERYPGVQNDMLDREDADNNVIPGQWRQGAQMVGAAAEPNLVRGTVHAQEQRDYLKDYYNSPAGSVPWQERMVLFH